MKTKTKEGCSTRKHFHEEKYREDWSYPQSQKSIFDQQKLRAIKPSKILDSKHWAFSTPTKNSLQLLRNFLGEI